MWISVPTRCHWNWSNCSQLVLRTVYSNFSLGVARGSLPSTRPGQPTGSITTYHPGGRTSGLIGGSIRGAGTTTMRGMVTDGPRMSGPKTVHITQPGVQPQVSILFPNILAVEWTDYAFLFVRSLVCLIVRNWYVFYNNLPLRSGLVYPKFALIHKVLGYWHFSLDNGCLDTRNLFWSLVLQSLYFMIFTDFSFFLIIWN